MTDTVAAPAASPAASPAPPPPPAAPAWHDTLPPELKTWAAGKSYDLTDPAKAAALGLNGHMNAERLIGADRAGRTVVLPSDDADAEGWTQVYKKMGRPDTAQGYELPVPEGADKKFSEDAAAWMYEAGIPKAAAQKLAGKWNEHMAKMAADQAAADQAALQAEHAALENDWGTGDAAAIQREMARRGAMKVGLDEASIDALQKATGYSKTMKALAKIGEMLGEKPAAGLEATGASSFAATPEAARGRKEALMADPEFRAKAMHPNSSQWLELKRLSAIIASVEEQR